MFHGRCLMLSGDSASLRRLFASQPFTAFGSNSFLNYEPSEADRLHEIAQELRKIVADAKKRLSASSAR
jgi:predicted P-loop ATPase/GTPase